MRRSSRIALGVLALTIVVRGTAHAARDIEFTTAPTPGQLDDLTRELGVSLFSAALTPAEGLGLARFELLASGTSTGIDGEAPYWRIATAGRTRSGHLLFPRATARLGLPAGIDIGASYGRLPGANVRTTQGEIKWAFIKGSTTVPAVALRLAHARMSGVDQMDLKTTLLDASVSKGVGPFTPYAGIGRLWLDSKVDDIPGDPDLSVKSSPGVNRLFVGARVSAGFFRLYAEAQRGAGVTSYSLALGLKVP